MTAFRDTTVKRLGPFERGEVLTAEKLNGLRDSVVGNALSEERRGVAYNTRLFGVVTTQIERFDDSGGNKIVGTGKMQVWNHFDRDTSNGNLVIEEAPAFVEVDVYNISQEVAAVGTYVWAVYHDNQYWLQTGTPLDLTADTSITLDAVKDVRLNVIAAVGSPGDVGYVPPQLQVEIDLAQYALDFNAAELCVGYTGPSNVTQSFDLAMEECPPSGPVNP